MSPPDPADQRPEREALPVIDDGCGPTDDGRNPGIGGVFIALGCLLAVVVLVSYLSGL